MSDDYENFEIVFEQTERLAGLKGMNVTESEVAEALSRAIGEGYAEAYLLSPQIPHGRKVEYSPDQLHELWFYVTPRGKSAAKGIPELEGASGPVLE